MDLTSSSNKTLRVFLPVYNRGRLTADFIEHLLGLLAGVIPIHVTLLDDASTDLTIHYAQKALPSIDIVKLDGSAYWGGALNAISELIQLQSSLARLDTIYMVCNDDIRFISRDGLLSAIDHVNKSSLVFARTIHACSPFEDHDLTSLLNSSTKLEPMMYFDVNSCSFNETNQLSKVNIAPTRAMLSTVQPWLAAKPIPPEIPHYLSDYWFTMSLRQQQFNLIYLPDFVCLNNASVSRNPAEGNNRLNSISQRVQKLIDAATPASPSYAIAWIAFLRAYSRTSSLDKKILRLRLKYFFGLIICRSNQFLGHAHQFLRRVGK